MTKAARRRRIAEVLARSEVSSEVDRDDQLRTVMRMMESSTRHLPGVSEKKRDG